jgi:hypothetical protein
MTDALQQPADTRMMGVVHSALRRDFVRTRLVVASLRPPDSRRRIAVAEHVVWMMDFLHHHHEGEDAGLYPLVVRKNPAAAELVKDMDAEHGLIAPAITALVTAADAYRRDTAGARDQLLGALEAMSTVLLPHLKREEVEMMPVVAASITMADWKAYDQETNIKSKGLLQLGVEGHWLIDGADAEGRACVVGLVPAVPRFILLHAFARSYRRRSARLWGGTEAADVPSLSLSLAPTWTG